MMKLSTVMLALIVAFAVSSASSARAACDPAGADATDVANARAAVAANCDCAGATNHGAYVSCAVQQIDATLVNGSCRGLVKKCAVHSSCGKTGFSTCYRTQNNKTKCTVTKPDACTKKQGGVGFCSSCCDQLSGPSCNGDVSTQCCTRTFTCGPFSSCAVTSQSDCSAAGGFPVGAGDCSAPNACSHATTTTPPSACCYGANQCVNTGTCECGLLGGQFMYFQACGPSTCVTTTTLP